MSANAIFQVDMALGYVAWALCIARYVWPRLTSIDRVDALRAIATLHSFRFFGLVFLLPGFVGPELPGSFAAPAAYGDCAAALLAILVLLAARGRVLFWTLVWAFNVVGTGDLLMAIGHAIRVDLPSIAGLRRRRTTLGSSGPRCDPVAWQAWATRRGPELGANSPLLRRPGRPAASGGPYGPPPAPSTARQPGGDTR